MRDSEAAAQLFLDSQALIERTLDVVCRSCRFSVEDAEEFRGNAQIHLIKDDYRILRSYEGRASLAGYLRAVLLRYALDYRNETLGKWRPSAVAKKLGPIAENLDQRLHRDREAREDAIRNVVAATGATREELEAIAQKLPQNYGRPRSAGPEPLDELAASRSEDPVENDERRQLAQRVVGALQEAMATFPREDRLMLQLFYKKGVAARDLTTFFPGSTERIIYRQLERTRERLKALLLATGISAPMIAELLGWKDFDTELDWGED